MISIKKIKKIIVMMMIMLSGLVTSNIFAQDSIRLTFGTTANNTMSMGLALTEVFLPATSRYSNGRLAIDYRGGGALCNEQGCIEQMRLKQIDLATISSGNVGAFGTTFDFINLPYIFVNNESAQRLIDKWLFRDLAARVEKEMKMHMIALIPVGGFRNIDNTKKQVKIPPDLKGLKIRVTKSPSEFNLVKAWGASPIPYDWAQLYEGLQSGVVEGMYLQDTFTVTGKFTEVIRHVTQVNAAYSLHPILMDLDRYRKLPEWARSALDKAGADLMAKGFDYDIRWQQTSADLIRKTAQVYTPNAEEMELWHKGATAAWVSLKGTYDPKLVKRILEEQGQHQLIKELEAAKAL